MKRLVWRGALFIAPLALTFWVIKFVYGMVDPVLGPLTAAVVRFIVPAAWLPAQFANGYVPGLSLVALVAILAVLGSLASFHIGRHGLSLIDWVFSLIPGVRTVYQGGRKIIDAIGKSGDQQFQKVVGVKFGGHTTFALVTGSSLTPDGKKLLAVFVPHFPNPTGGFVLYVPEDEVWETGLTPQEAIKIGISLGVLSTNNMFGAKK